MQAIHYKAVLDGLAKGISIIFLIIFITILCMAIIEPKVAAWIVLGVLILATLITYTLHPRYYTISFDVDSVRISYWIIPIDSMLDDGFSYHYVPDKECIERYLFFADKKPVAACLLNPISFCKEGKDFLVKNTLRMTPIPLGYIACRENDDSPFSAVG